MKLITLKSTNLELTPAVQSYAEEKLGSLEKFLSRVGQPHNLYIELAKTTKHHRRGPYFYAEADIVIPGGHLRASASGYDLFAAIDFLYEEIKREVMKCTQKSRAKEKRGRLKAKKILHYHPAALQPHETKMSERDRREGN